MKYDRIWLRVAVALSGAVLMSLEILGSRVLSPNYGSSVYVWGSLITTFLLALAVGYTLGGRVADRGPSLSILSIILSSAGVLVLPAVVWGPKLLETISQIGLDARRSSLNAALILFLPPSVAMGMVVTPFAVRIATRRMEAVGSVAGGYSGLSSAGSILGTLVMTFLLIPRFPVQALLLGLSATLVLCGFLLMSDRGSIAIAVASLSACGMAAYVRGPAPRVGGEQVLLQKDTPYHHIAVTQLDTTRYLRFDNLTQSGINLARQGNPVFFQEEAFFLSFAFRPSIKRICMIGLGGGSFPRVLSNLDPGSSIETAEIDPAVRHIATEYFLYKESSRNRTFVEDGRVFLTRPGRAYDLIVLDAFNSTGVPFHLTTREFFQTVRKRLAPDGVFAANFIGKLMGRDGRLFWATYQTIRRQFGQVYLISFDLASGKKAPEANVILFATISADVISAETIDRHAKELALRWKLTQLPSMASALLHSPDPPPGTPELTDAFAPVEALQHF